MPRGDKSKYTGKQERKADHIAESYKSSGVPEKEAERIAWATVNKENGGGKKSGSGRGQPESHASSWSSFAPPTCNRRTKPIVGSSHFAGMELSFRAGIRRQ